MILVVAETIDRASDLFRGITYPSNEKIMRIEMEGFEKLLQENKDQSIILGGVVAGRIYSIPTVKELLEDIMEDAEEIISNFPSLIKKS